MSDIPISVKQLVKHFDTPSGPLNILDGIDLQLGKGESLAIVGPSGSGKSTLLHIVGTLDTPSGGTVELLGEDPFDLDEPRLAAFRNRHIGFVFQEHHLLPQLSAWENVVLPSVAAGEGSDETGKRARDLLDRVGLGARQDHRPGQLSGGERQRVAVARALLNRPSILLADEPTGSLDRVNAESIGKLLLELQQQENITLVCVTHNDELAGWFGRQVRLDQGKLVEI